MALGLATFVGRMFGTEKAAMSVIDGVKSGLDKLVYTKEERADDAAAATTQARAMVVSWMEKTQGQNIARRFLAILIAFTWLIQYAAATILNIAAIWATDAIKIQKSADLIGANADSMTGAMMLILGFYFAAPHLGKIVEGAMSRFGKSAT